MYSLDVFQTSPENMHSHLKFALVQCSLNPQDLFPFYKPFKMFIEGKGFFECVTKAEAYQVPLGGGS